MADEKEIDELIRLLKSNNEELHFTAINKLVKIGKPAIPYLINTLADKDFYWKNAAIFNPKYEHMGDTALHYMINFCTSIEKLNDLQEEFEKSYTDWKNKQPAGFSKEKIEVQHKMAAHMQYFSKKRLELTGRNGKLLLGETIKPPKGKGGKKYKLFRARA